MPAPDRSAAPTRPRGGHADEGSVLIFVLVLIVIAGLLIVPLLTYTGAVLRANRVVSDQTKQAEAVKGGLRVALSDPLRIFEDCNNFTDLAPTDVNGYTVATTCTELEEVAANFGGYEVPIGATAIEVGHEVRDTFSGGTLDGGPIPPYPATAHWWAGSESRFPETGKVWMPSLPKWPSIPRDGDAPFQMPSPGFDCQVFLPGNYDDPVVLDSGNYAFASGVYYFAERVEVTGDANVIVGAGLEEFDDGCSDNLQIADNVIGDIGGGYGIVGGGATWVFGEQGRLIVDDSGGGTPSLVFNQRYDTVDRGGRINIMTVNGDDRFGALADHDVLDVSFVPQSLVQDDALDPDLDPDDPAQPSPEPIAADTYVASSIDYTDAARPPLAPQGLTIGEFIYDDGVDTRGLLVVEWNEVMGQRTGGAVIDGYDVAVTPGPPAACEPDDVIITPGADPADPVRFTCVVGDLDLGNVTVSVNARNLIGAGAPAVVTTLLDSTDDPVGPPDAPSNVTVADGAAPGAAQVSWDASASSLPVESYTVTAVAVGAATPVDEPPVAVDLDAVVTQGGVVTVRLPAHDPDGDALTATVDDSPLAAGDPAGFPPGSVTTSGLDVTIQADPGALVTASPYELPYVIDDGTQTVAAVLRLTVADAAFPPGPSAPVAHPASIEVVAGTTTAISLPATHPDGATLSIVAIDDTVLVAADPTATVTTAGIDVSVTTNAPNGTYAVGYTVDDGTGTQSTSTLDVVIDRSETSAGACTATLEANVPVPTVCEITGLADLTPSGPASGFGYRFDVVATNGAGDSAPASSSEPYPVSFAGTGTALEPPTPTSFDRNVVPFVPDPVIEVRAAGPGVARLHVPGYVAVPMGRIMVDNPIGPTGDPVDLTGGVVAGTYDVVDAREQPGVPDSVPIGYRNDIVLQRKVRIVSTAGTSRSTAIVQVNEDGSWAVNEWAIE